jgi:hypothetical protein
MLHGDVKNVEKSIESPKQTANQLQEHEVQDLVGING